MAHTHDLRITSRIPWKKVAAFIVERGGSYRFGNATCRRRWDELVRHETRDLGKDVRKLFYSPQSYVAPGIEIFSRPAKPDGVRVLASVAAGDGAR